MDIFTLYVGQGALAAVRSGGQAIIIDSYMPNSEEFSQLQIEKSLSDYLKNSEVCGLVLTGFDSDHAHPAGIESILTNYKPSWIMYPKYYKDTETASDVFKIIERHEKQRKNTTNPLKRHSVRVDRVDSRSLDYLNLTNKFTVELFSPHTEDMDNSNNSSIVLKLTGTAPNGFTYLVTGDTEKDRWDSINKFFGNFLGSDVMAAPHHGANSGVNSKAVLLIQPNTVLISAGVDNQYNHPHSQAVHVYQTVAKRVFATNANRTGTCLFTRRVGNDFDTRLVRHPDDEPLSRVSGVQQPHVR